MAKGLMVNIFDLVAPKTQGEAKTAVATEHGKTDSGDKKHKDIVSNTHDKGTIVQRKQWAVTSLGQISSSRWQKAWSSLKLLTPDRTSGLDKCPSNDEGLGIDGASSPDGKGKDDIKDYIFNQPIATSQTLSPDELRLDADDFSMDDARSLDSGRESDEKDYNLDQPVDPVFYPALSCSFDIRSEACDVESTINHFPVMSKKTSNARSFWKHPQNGVQAETTLVHKQTGHTKGSKRTLCQHLHHLSAKRTCKPSSHLNGGSAIRSFDTEYGANTCPSPEQLDICANNTLAFEHSYALSPPRRNDASNQRENAVQEDKNHKNIKTCTFKKPIPPHSVPEVSKGSCSPAEFAIKRVPALQPKVVLDAPVTLLHEKQQEKHADCGVKEHAVGSQLPQDAPATLWCYAMNGKASAAEKLLASEKINISASLVQRSDANGFTPLHMACRNADTSFVALLINAGSCVNQQSHAGIRPIHEAAAGGSCKVIEMLLAAGADPTVRTYSGKSALDLARSTHAAQHLQNYSSDLNCMYGRAPLLVTDKLLSRDLSCSSKTMCGTSIIDEASGINRGTVTFELATVEFPRTYLLPSDSADGERQWQHFYLLSDLLRYFNTSECRYLTIFPSAKVCSFTWEQLATCLEGSQLSAQYTQILPKRDERHSYVKTVKSDVNLTRQMFQCDTLAFSVTDNAKFGEMLEDKSDDAQSYEKEHTGYNTHLENIDFLVDQDNDDYQLEFL